MNRQSEQARRLEGLDAARFFAFVGMVIVNFKAVMVTAGADPEVTSGIAEFLQGRAAATFVVLAGVGLGLNAKRHEWDRTLTTTLKRAGFLLVAGLLNLLIFDADIIHYYAFYFLIGVFFARTPTSLLILTMAGIVVSFPVLAITLDYDAGWDWNTYSYAGFWTLEGFVRNLFFNGWHPLIPWLAFFLLGILIGRANLGDRTTQLRLLLAGIFVFVITTFASHELVRAVAAIDMDAAVLFSVQPVPPMPLYMLVGGSAACVTIGLCLILESPLRSYRLLHIFTTPGRQTLTLYFAHIVIGMGALEALGMIGGQDTQSSLIAAALFTVVATGYALIWSRFFSRGALEALMQKVSG